jgi:regulator of protease activity HflC (stomatin/prohibitin superfamily)
VCGVARRAWLLPPRVTPTEGEGSVSQVVQVQLESVAMALQRCGPPPADLAGTPIVPFTPPPMPFDELQRLTADAGVEILQLRMNDLAYAPEIAQSMLLRQQASSMIAARRTLVEGATETVKSAVSRMDAAGIELRGPARERFVASMMLVLTSGERVHTMMPIDLESEKG